jgi:hypothetical protein
MPEQTIRAVVFKEGDWWIIQGLEYDFVALARRREDVPNELRRWLLALACASQQHGVELFHGYTPAPRKYWRMYEQATPWEPTPGVEFPSDLHFNPTIETRLAA